MGQAEWGRSKIEVEGQKRWEDDFESHGRRKALTCVETNSHTTLILHSFDDQCNLFELGPNHVSRAGLENRVK
jgi:hypothetical protein